MWAVVPSDEVSDAGGAGDGLGHVSGEHSLLELRHSVGGHRICAAIDRTEEGVLQIAPAVLAVQPQTSEVARPGRTGRPADRALGGDRRGVSL